ncbi:hypothetical protein ZIOFF_052582 [Zingiber officinale]|uniref:Tetratricopeptide repeat protein n=1 Tax=Zingiber officinale TaxID=94328 RepID=A0A8J5FM91_ZINOF|nr:hypothetical protein ZIOFF_052582 [Zingiber officinale]
MGKPTAKKTKGSGRRVTNPKSKHNRSSEHAPTIFQEDTQVFVHMAQGLKEEGNRLFHSRGYEGALVKYENAIKLLPKNHADPVYRHYNRAAWGGVKDLNQLELACKYIDLALHWEPNNLNALALSERLKKAMETNGTVVDGIAALLPPDAAVVSSKKNRKKNRKA